jgi:hypothetical protein
MAKNRMSTDDLEILLQADDEQGGKLRKSMMETASVEFEYWKGILQSLKGESIRGPRSKPEDGLTHGEAIVNCLKGAKNGLGTNDLLSALSEAGHEMSAATFYQTINKLVEGKQVKKAKVEKGKRDNVYTVK